MIQWLRSITPGQALKWGGVIFAYCVGVLFVVSVILGMVDTFA